MYVVRSIAINIGSENPVRVGRGGNVASVCYFGVIAISQSNKGIDSSRVICVIPASDDLPQACSVHQVVSAVALISSIRPRRFKGNCASQVVPVLFSDIFLNNLTPGLCLYLDTYGVKPVRSCVSFAEQKSTLRCYLSWHKIFSVSQVKRNHNRFYDHRLVDQLRGLYSFSDSDESVDVDDFSIVEIVGDSQESSNVVSVEVHKETAIVRVGMRQICQFGIR